jgi:hypothetical protein
MPKKCQKNAKKMPKKLFGIALLCFALLCKIMPKKFKKKSRNNAEKMPKKC